MVLEIRCVLSILVGYFSNRRIVRIRQSGPNGAAVGFHEARYLRIEFLDPIEVVAPARSIDLSGQKDSDKSSIQRSRVRIVVPRPARCRCHRFRKSIPVTPNAAIPSEIRASEAGSLHFAFALSRYL